MIQHFLIEQKGCPYCRLYKGVVEKFNAIVKPENRIRVLDVTDEMYFGVKLHPILDSFQWKGTPTLYLNGIVIEGALSKWDIIGRLKAYFESIGERVDIYN